ncbi:Aste57867_19636 [Aphanomyces stellatus]|uniref:Aste57867_19636 protein n=1 Tax=Aphanomyces stellatus TaxID=120398 RepID=A0A485LEW5_9STRA|nr:hypothetical protein As57867_019571 [Aphanomyces stellatus]VFT96336.1 Aste57867_19636 [Aphanomyces stellatus]
MVDAARQTAKEPVLGLTLGFFKHLVTLYGGRDAFEGLSTKAVCVKFVKPATLTHRLSMVDYVLDHYPSGGLYVKEATWFVSHAWRYTFLDVVDALDAFFDDQGLEPDDVAVWFCMFNNNQHMIHDVDFTFWVDSFQSALASIGRVVMVLSPWHNPTTLTRTWCVFELYVAVLTHARFEVAMGKTQKQAFLDDMRQDYDAFFRMLATIKSEASTTAVPQDRDNIVALMKAAHITFADLDRMLLDVFDGWMLRILNSQIDGADTLADQAEWLVVLGGMFRDKKDLGNAKQCIDRALWIYRHALNDKKDETWDALGGAADLSFMTNEPREVWEPMAQEALAHQIQLFGRDHVKSLGAMYSLGSFLVESGAFADGMPLLEECYARCTQALSDSNSLTLEALSAIGYCWMLQTKYVEAEPCLVQCYERQCRASGADHPSTQNTASYLAMIYFNQGKYTLAATMRQDIYDVSLRTLGPTHRGTCIAFGNLGSAMMMTGQYDQAKVVLEACHDMIARTGQPTEMRLKFELKLGQLHLCAGDGNLAHRRLVQVHDGIKTIHSASHPLARIALYWLCFLLYDSTFFLSMAQLDSVADELHAAGLFHDTWIIFPCHGCFEPIRGTSFTCPACPRFARRFCRACVAQAKFASFCAHNTRVEGMAPPPRRVQEMRLARLAQEDRWTDYDRRYLEYDAYCNAQHVPLDERAVRSSRNTFWNPATIGYFQWLTVVVLGVVMLVRRK